MSKPTLCQRDYWAAVGDADGALAEATRAEQCGAMMWAVEYRKAAKEASRRANAIKDELKGTPYEIT
jgi:hypothetical protein